jgi:hypothetical protein
MVPHSDQQRVLDCSGQPKERPAGMGDDFPHRIEQQEAQPLRPGGPEISG